MKKLVSYTVDKILIDKFIETTKMSNDKMSNVVEKAIEDYVSKNSETNEYDTIVDFIKKQKK